MPARKPPKSAQQIAKESLDLLNDGFSVTVRELSSSLIQKFGGANGLAQAVKEVYDDGDTAPHVRAKILSDVMEVIRQGNILQPVDPTNTGDADDAELAAEAEALLRKAQG